MLEVKVNGREGEVFVKVDNCTMEELMADLTAVCESIYNNLKREREKEEFKDCLKYLANDELYCKTPEELHELAKKKEKEMQKKAKEELKKFLKELFSEEEGSDKK